MVSSDRKPNPGSRGRREFLCFWNWRGQEARSGAAHCTNPRDVPRTWSLSPPAAGSASSGVAGDWGSLRRSLLNLTLVRPVMACVHFWCRHEGICTWTELGRDGSPMGAWSYCPKPGKWVSGNHKGSLHSSSGRLNTLSQDPQSQLLTSTVLLFTCF